MGNVSSQKAEHLPTIRGFISVKCRESEDSRYTVTNFWTTPYWTPLFVVYDIVWLFRVVILEVQTIVLLTATFGYVMTRNRVHTGFLLSVCRHWLMAPNSSSDSKTGCTLKWQQGHLWAGFSDAYKYGKDICFTHVHNKLTSVNAVYCTVHTQDRHKPCPT